MELETFKFLLVDLGAPLTVTAIFLWMVIDAYRCGKDRVLKKLDIVVDVLRKIQGCMDKTLDVLELVQENQKELQSYRNERID